MEKKTTTNSKKGQKPFQTIRHGAVAANIWERQSQTGYSYFEYSLSRSWKSSNSGKEGYSQNFYARNEEQVIACIEDATNFINELMAESPENVEQSSGSEQAMLNDADEQHPSAA